MSIYFQYGSHQHEAGECSFVESKEIVYSDDKKPLYTQCRWDVMGTIIKSTSAKITAAIAALRSAYSRNGQNMGWYFVGGTKTAHIVQNADTISGIRVVRPPQFPESRGVEYAGWRNYTLSLEWEEEPADRDLVSMTEKISYQGNGGKDWGLLTPITGMPISADKTLRSPVVVHQAGRAIGCNGYYPPAASPLWSSQPPLHGPSMVVEYADQPGPARLRETTWSYTFFFAARPGVRRP